MATVIAPRPLTAGEYAQLADTPGLRDELIEGERVMSPSSKLAHGRMIRHLERLIEPQLTHIAATIGLHDTVLRIECEQGWFFQTGNQTDNILEPDLMVVREDDTRRAIASDSWFEGTPILIVEVVSPSERRSRRLQKIGLYLEMGVRHVLEVDYKRSIILLYTPGADAPTLYKDGGQIIVPFQAAVDEIFAVLR